MIQESRVYNLVVLCPYGSDAVPGPDLVMPCQKVMALVVSTEKSVPDPSVKMAEGTYKLITPNVQCMLSSDDSHLAPRKFSLTATCNMQNLPAFRLDPVRSKPQHALITITAMLGDNFVVETVQLLEAESAAKAKESLKGVLNLAMHMHTRDKKRPVTWADDRSPLDAKKCRILGRSATGNAVERPTPNI